jgi:hypothetical protein
MAMISNMTDEEILDFLMTSEFENDISPDEFKFLLGKWKYLYRLFYGKHERIKEDLMSEISSIESKLNSAKMENMKLMVESAKKTDMIDSMKNRKLTFKERWKGKIITEDENK